MRLSGDTAARVAIIVAHFVVLLLSNIVHVPLERIAFLSEIVPDLLVQFKRSILLLLSGQIAELVSGGVLPGSRLLITAEQRVCHCRPKALTLDGAGA